MKDHLIAKMHNDLRDASVMFVGAEQLRERLVRVVAPLVAENKALEAKVAELTDEVERLGYEMMEEYD